jgi:nickel-dependent lactate racemase
MQVDVDYGLDHIALEVPAGSLIAAPRSSPAPALPDPAAALREALEAPRGFPPLRRALTPDDHVGIVLDQHGPHLVGLLMPLLEHIAQAGIPPEAITLVSAPDATSPAWPAPLPAKWQQVRIEVHDPSDRQRLSYLATTRKGRRVYLNRTVVDADQLVILARRGYDPLLGYAGGAGALFPALGDEATRKELSSQLTMAVPGAEPWPVRKEADEVAWLLGAPFMIQLIEGAGDQLTHIVGGLAATASEGERLLDARWRVAVERPTDTVIAAVSGDPAHHDFADLARALACAARVVKADGRIALLSRARPALGRGAELIRQADDADTALALLRHETPADMAAAFLWASAARHATIYLLSDLPAEIAEELFTVPLEHAGQVRRLLTAGDCCVVLADAHKTLAVPA